MGTIYIYKTYFCVKSLIFVLLIVVFFSAQFSVCVSTPAGAINYTTSSENKFVTYENSTEGTKIDYPKGWTVS